MVLFTGRSVDTEQAVKYVVLGNGGMIAFV